MTVSDIEHIIITHGLPMQSILSAAFTVENISTIGGGSCLNQGSGRKGDPAFMIDRAISVTKHIHEAERDLLIRWAQTDNVDPKDWPRHVVAFFKRVPYQAAHDMAQVAESVI